MPDGISILLFSYLLLSLRFRALPAEEAWLYVNSAGITDPALNRGAAHGPWPHSTGLTSLPQLPAFPSTHHP